MGSVSRSTFEMTGFIRTGPPAPNKELALNRKQPLDREKPHTSSNPCPSSAESAVPRWMIRTLPGRHSDSASSVGTIPGVQIAGDGADAAQRSAGQPRLCTGNRRDRRHHAPVSGKGDAAERLAAVGQRARRARCVPGSGVEKFPGIYDGLHGFFQAAVPRCSDPPLTERPALAEGQGGERSLALYFGFICPMLIFGGP